MAAPNGPDGFRDAYDSGYRAGYDAGYRAGMKAAGIPAPSHGQAQQTQYSTQHPPSLPVRPPQLSQSPGTSSQQPLQALNRAAIWQPTVGTTWQYVLGHPVQLDSRTCPISQAEVWILDVFDTPASTVAALHAKHRKVIAYFSAGSFEDWRPDSSAFAKSDLGRNMDGWDGEKWLQTNSNTVRDIMQKRMDIAVSKGFDGIDPDNVDGYDNKNGLGLKKADAIDYVCFLAREAHARGLSVGLKNAGDIVRDVIDHVEYCVQEQAVQYDDEQAFRPFLQKGKPIFHVEYPKGDDPDNKKQNDDKRVEGKKRDKAFSLKHEGWSTIVKNVKLDQWVQLE